MQFRKQNLTFFVGFFFFFLLPGMKQKSHPPHAFPQRAGFAYIWLAFRREKLRNSRVLFEAILKTSLGYGRRMRSHQSSSADACGHFTMPSITYRPNSQIAQRICVFKSCQVISHGRKLLQKTIRIKPAQLLTSTRFWVQYCTGWNVRILVPVAGESLWRPCSPGEATRGATPRRVLRILLPLQDRRGKKNCWKFLDEIEFNLLEVFCWQENRKHVSVLLLL